MGGIVDAFPAIDPSGRLEAQLSNRGLSVADAQKILVLGVLQALDLSHGCADGEFHWIVHCSSHLLRRQAFPQLVDQRDAARIAFS